MGILNELTNGTNDNPDTDVNHTSDLQFFGGTDELFASSTGNYQ